MFRFFTTLWVCCIVLATAGFNNHSFAQSGNVQPITEQIQWKDLLTSNDLVCGERPMNNRSFEDDDTNERNAPRRPTQVLA